MSSIAFHAPNHVVRVGGAERAWAGSLCAQIMHGVLGLHDFPALDRPPLNRLLRMVPDGHYIFDGANAEQVSRALRMALGGSSNCLSWNGHGVDDLAFALNTALVIGGSPLQFSARMHGSCEIHGWVDGPNRAWLADIVEEGLANGVLRRSHQTQYENWPGVEILLRNSSRTPVVMSYSVTEPFPSLMRPLAKPYKMTEEEQDAYAAEVEAWDALDADAQWDQACIALRARGDDLELRPENWTTFRFAHCLSAFYLLAEDWESRLNCAFPA